MGMKQVRTDFVESAFSAPREIDEAAHVIKGVKVLGSDSRNGRVYSEAAMARAQGLYEGVNVNIDHPDSAGKTRGVMESVGVLKNVRLQDKALFADFHYLESHPHTATIIERAKRFPNNFGLSHNAEGKATRKGSKLIVESIDRVRSVDLVTDPATNVGLFEGVETVSQITLKEFAEQTKNPLLLKLVEEGEMGAMPMDAPADAGSGEDQIKTAFRSVVMAAFDDDSLDMKATLAKIKEALKAYEKVKGGGEKEEPTEESKPDAATESIKAELADLRKLLMESAIAATGLKRDKLTEAQATKLAECKTPSEAVAFIESLPPIARGGPGFTPGSRNREEPAAGYKGGKKEFLEALGRG